MSPPIPDVRVRTSDSVQNAKTTLPKPVRIPRLYREQNGWCIYSTRLWLALEVKNIRHETVLVDSLGDTFDGSLAEQMQPLPCLQLVDNLDLLNASTESSSVELLLALDDLFPENGPLLVPPEKRDVIAEAIDRYQEATEALRARQSPRAGWLFCNEEGFRLDALPRECFERFLDTVEEALQHKAAGPFFGGANLTAADVVYAPLLERYAVQLPCLHDNLRPRDSQRWPKLAEWYSAMDSVPAYTCRIKGDAPSWRKVLFREPWWPDTDLWHPRETVGPKGELCLDDTTCVEVYGSVDVSKFTWQAYAKLRPSIGPTPATQAALVLLQNYKAVSFDAEQWMKEQGYDESELDSLDEDLREIMCALLNIDDGTQSDSEINNLSLALLTYLDSRVCVPRDMGAPVANCIRQLKFRVDQHRYHR